MRMWNVEPRIMCDKHLLGEHVEMHMFVGTVKKEKSLDGFINSGLVEICKIKQRHDSLVREMKKRKMRHRTPMKFIVPQKYRIGFDGAVDPESNRIELFYRCEDCREKILLNYYL